MEKELKKLTKMSLLIVAMMLLTVNAYADKKPEIKFEKTTIDFGTFSQDDPIRTCVFKFTNVGKGKLVINYVHTACGCTVAEYPKDFINPGATGEIKVTYDGTGKMPGKFRKYVQVFSNCKEEMSRVFIQGDMSALPKEELKKAASK
ncbi:MAG: DUF1573 domain-containing protein [Bacteroidaceae bacterium]|nr:DUF1573 domain-containing protein [Bacteroidaceae bacterium]